LAYSNDNGQTWTENPSFDYTGLGQVGFSNTGKIFIGGWQYVFYSTNYSGVNPRIVNADVTGANSFDLTFSSEDINNYLIYYTPDGKEQIGIITATRDNSDNSVVHLTASSDLPNDTLTFFANAIFDLNGFPVINNYFTPSSVSIKKIDETTIRIFPNPAYNKITVFSQDFQNLWIDIYSIEGKLLKKGRLNKSGELTIDDMPRGTYILKINTKDKQYISKLIKY